MLWCLEEGSLQQRLSLALHDIDRRLHCASEEALVALLTRRSWAAQGMVPMSTWAGAAEGKPMAHTFHQKGSHAGVEWLSRANPLADTDSRRLVKHARNCAHTHLGQGVLWRCLQLAQLQSESYPGQPSTLHQQGL